MENGRGPGDPGAIVDGSTRAASVRPLSEPGLVVELAADELEGAIHVGWERARDAYVRGRTPNAAHVDDLEGTYFVGAVGEKAFGKLTGLYWPGRWTPDRGRGDVGGWEVKASMHPTGRLIVRPDMPDGLRLVLMVPCARGDLRRWRCAGTLRAGAAKQERWKTQLRPGAPWVWAVPQGALDACVVPGGLRRA